MLIALARETHVFADAGPKSLACIALETAHSLRKETCGRIVLCAVDKVHMLALVAAFQAATKMCLEHLARPKAATWTCRRREGQK